MGEIWNLPVSHKKSIVIINIIVVFIILCYKNKQKLYSKLWLEYQPDWRVYSCTHIWRMSKTNLNVFRSDYWNTKRHIQLSWRKFNWRLKRVVYLRSSIQSVLQFKFGVKPVIKYPRIRILARVWPLWEWCLLACLAQQGANGTFLSLSWSRLNMGIHLKNNWFGGVPPKPLNQTTLPQ